MTLFRSLARTSILRGKSSVEDCLKKRPIRVLPRRLSEGIFHYLD